MNKKKNNKKTKINLLSKDNLLEADSLLRSGFGLYCDINSNEFITNNNIITYF